MRIRRSGIDQRDLPEFYNRIKNDFDLDIIGLMCIPPFVESTTSFVKMKVCLKR